MLQEDRANPASVAGASGQVLVPFTVVGSGQPLTKRLTLAADGSIEKSPNVNLYSGWVRTRWIATLADLLRFLDRLQSNQAIIYGLCHRNGAPVKDDTPLTTKQALGDGEVARTREFFEWNPGPAILMFDIDGSPADGVPVGGAAVAALRQMHPVFADVPIAWRPSASSGVNGAGIKGQRLYVLVQDGSLITEAGPVLMDLQWVRGLGRVDITASGQLVRRGFLDSAVWHPEWLDFAGPPILGDGVTREPPPSFVSPGPCPMVDLAQLLAEAGALRREAETLWRDARLARAEEARAVRAAYIEATGKTWLNRDPLQDEHLGPDFPLITREGEAVRVRDLLRDPVRWHKAQFHDPCDPDYQDDPRIAVALLLGDYPTPIIYSHAHGGIKYRLFDAEQAFAGLGEAEDIRDGEDDPAEAAVAPQVERLRTLRRAQAREGLELAARSLAERTRGFASVIDALDDPNTCTIHAGTGIGKTYTLADAVAAVALLLTYNAPPTLVICGTSTHNVDNFYKEVSEALERSLEARYLANGEDQAVAKTASAEEAKELLKRCARIQHNRTILPFRNREGHYTYRLILCTYAAINRIGDAIDSRGRVLRLLAGMRSLEEKHGLEYESIPHFGDEVDAGLMNAKITISLQFRKFAKDDGMNGNPRFHLQKWCPGKACEKCLYQPLTYAAEVTRHGIKQIEIGPHLFRMEGTTELTLDWLPNVIGPKLAEEGNYEIYGILVDELPAIDPTERYTDEDGNERYRINPEGQIIRWMRQPRATLRRLLPRDRKQDRLIHPRDIEPGADIQWPNYPCEVWSLVSWDREAFSDLATLCLSTPKLLSASFSAGTLAMVEHAFGPQEHGQVLTPEDRKMRHVHIAAIPDTLSIGEEEAIRLLSHGPVLWVVQTKAQADKLFEVVKAWTSPLIKPSIYSGGALHQIEVFRHNLLITYPRSSLARGANLGHCRTVICHTDYYGALLHELGLGHDDMRVALEEGNQANLLQAIGRIMRQDENNPADDKRRFVILQSTADRDGSLIEDGRYLIPRMQALALEVAYSQFNIHPRRVLDAQHEFFTQGLVTRDDTLDHGVTADKLTKRQRRLTAEVRAAAREAASQERAEAKLLEREESKRLATEAKETARREKAEARLWEMAAAGVSWTDARRQAHIDRTHNTPEKVQALRLRYQEIALRN